MKGYIFSSSSLKFHWLHFLVPLLRTKLLCVLLRFQNGKPMSSWDFLIKDCLMQTGVGVGVEVYLRTILWMFYILKCWRRKLGSRKDARMIIWGLVPVFVVKLCFSFTWPLGLLPHSLCPIWTFGLCFLQLLCIHGEVHWWSLPLR